MKNFLKNLKHLFSTSLSAEQATLTRARDDLFAVDKHYKLEVDALKTKVAALEDDLIARKTQAAVTAAKLLHK